jgi:hypothetical protein
MAVLNRFALNLFREFDSLSVRYLVGPCSGKSGSRRIPIHVESKSRFVLYPILLNHSQTARRYQTFVEWDL